MNSSIQNISNTINNISLLNLSTNYWKTNASLSTVLSTYLTTQPLSISTANACITNLSCTSIAIGSNVVATQNYVTSQGYISATPNVDVNMNTNNLNLTNGKLNINGNGIVYFYANSNLATTYSGARIVLWGGTNTPTSTGWYGLGMNGGQLVYNVTTGAMHSFQVDGTQVAYFNSGGLAMNSNSIGFTNNGAGLKWGTNSNSQIYDNDNLYITTDDYLNITAPTQINITSNDTYFSGNVYNYESLLAS
jgi:hypothetical protein